ncbi:MAG: geranylgeranylglyceryl/heptaprenylglyceryl phosphate synthase [Candidatus Aenigmatarchaeota archaeon]
MGNILETLKKVKHITQVDPEKEEKNTDKLLQLIGESGTDAVIYAGSSGVNPRNLLDVLNRSQKTIKQPKIVAPSHPSIVPPYIVEKILYSSPPLADYLLIYDVLNAQDFEFLVGRHKDWDKEFYLSNKLPPVRYAVEIGYILITHDATVKKVVPIDEDFSVENILSYASVGARRHNLLYLETTGYDSTITGIEPSVYIRKIREWTTEIGFPDVYLISGGGIRSEEEARKRLKAGADAINVGNPLYSPDQTLGHRIYLSTIRGAKPKITLEEHNELYKRLYSVSLI